MSAIAEKRCPNHREREAAALCPRCTNLYCRECVTEHEGRVLCAACLAEMAGAVSAARRHVSLVRSVAAIASFMLVWFCFLALGRVLLELPDAFHEGEIWSTESPIDSDP